MTTTLFDAAVIGAGPAGLATAISLATTGCNTVLAGPPHNPDPERPDTRTTALLRASVHLLRNTGVWQLCERKAAPLKTIRLIDDTGRLLRAPEVLFDCSELGGEPFGYNVANTDLVAALYERARELPNLSLVATSGAVSVQPGDASVTVTLAEGTALTARLVAGADGRKSICRAATQIGKRDWRYPQMALAFNFSHSDSHENCSNEFHRKAGPFTTVPLPGDRSSLVWVETPIEAERLMTLADDALIEIMEQRLHGLLGTVTEVGPRAAFPLGGMIATRFAANRIALVGEAAHVIPPIGAQGLNLGFRDAAALADHAGKAIGTDSDPGSGMVMQGYDMARRADVGTRTVTVDLLNRSLISGFLPLHAARGIGLQILAAAGPLRRFFMREGLSPQFGLPRLMRPTGPGASGV